MYRSPFYCCTLYIPPLAHFYSFHYYLYCLCCHCCTQYIFYVVPELPSRDYKDLLNWIQMNNPFGLLQITAVRNLFALFPLHKCQLFNSLTKLISVFNLYHILHVLLFSLLHIYWYFHYQKLWNELETLYWLHYLPDNKLFLAAFQLCLLWRNRKMALSP